MFIIKRCILHYYFQLHVSAPSCGAIFRLKSIFLRRQCLQLTVLLYYILLTVHHVMILGK